MPFKKNQKVSIVIPVYQPDFNIFKKLKQMLAKQTIKAEIVETWNLPEAKSLNFGIKKAKGDIIVTLEQDCIPEDKFWLEKLVSVLKDETVVAGVSDLYLPKSYWKKFPFILKIITLNDRKLRKPTMCLKGCVYRKKDLQEIGLFNETLDSIDADTYDKLIKIGKIVRANTTIFHLHQYKNVRSFLEKYYFYSKENGKIVRSRGVNFSSFLYRFIRAIPFLGMASITYRYPFRKYFLLFPIFFIFATAIHVVNIFGFWDGFFSKINKDYYDNNKHN